MTRNSTQYARLVSLVVTLSLFSTSFVRAQDQAEKQRRHDLAQQNKAQAQRIENSVDTGIFVDTPKIYDDSSLQLMLNAARARLAMLQTFDQTGLLNKIGSITGATLQQQAISAQVLGPPVPSATVNSLGGTEVTNATSNAAGQITQTTVASAQPVQNVATTSPQLTATAPALPPSAAVPSSGFNVSSLDALNEMMQLTYEIANLQLLLEGSLSDRFVNGQRIVKPRTTIGFPINVTGQREYKDAVAVVEVEAMSPPFVTLSQERPAVTALLPREKTYNVAAITDHMTSIGGGLVTQVLSGGFSFLRGRKSYYIVQDQDTLATMQQSSDPKTRTAFSWQFRPVLGQSYVRSGLKQTFVQLAVPIHRAAGCFGTLRITTYWRKYDRKHGVLREVFPETIRNIDLQPIPAFDLTPIIESLDVKDIGSGQVLTSLTGVEGRFLSGTYIRVGNNYYREGSPGFTSETTKIRFVAPATELAKYGAFLVTRDGKETEILDPEDPNRLAALDQTCGIGPPASVIQVDGQPLSANPQPHPTPKLEVEVAAYDTSNSILTAKLTNLYTDPLSKQVKGPALEKYVIVVGGKVFGLSDAPIERNGDAIPGQATLRAVVPSSLLLSGTQVEVKPLFWKTDYTASIPTGVFSATATSDKIVLLEQKATESWYLLYGNRLKDNSAILIPSGVSWEAIYGIPQSETLRTFKLSADQAKNFKEIVLQKAPGERPIKLTLPTLATADAKPALTVKGRLAVGMDEATVQGDNLDKLKKVRFKDAEIKFTLSKDKKSVTLSGLVAARVTTTPEEQELEFEFEDGKKATIKIDVVSGIYEIIERK